MELLDKKAEKIIKLSLAFSIPFVLLTLYLKNGKIGLTEIIITFITVLIGYIIFKIVKRQANK